MSPNTKGTENEGFELDNVSTTTNTAESDISISVDPSSDEQDKKGFDIIAEREKQIHIPDEFTDSVSTGTKSQLLYTINDNPPWHTCLILGLQHYLMMVESTVSIPYLLTPMMCMDKSDPARGAIASTIIFASGIITLLQTTWGIRLPIVQGGTHAMLGPAIAILSLMPCPDDDVLNAMSPEEREETWQIRMRHIQGGLCMAAVFQVLLGLTGMVGVMIRLITPLVIVPTVLLIGISLFPIAANKAATYWPIAILTMFLLVLFSQYLADIPIPIPYYSFQLKKMEFAPIYVFKLFPVILAMSIVWILCFILTGNDVIDKDNGARTDLHSEIITEAPWFRIPYPCQWGMPTVTLAGVMGILAGIVSSVVESIGDYYACARLAGAPAPPTHAMNRGIFMEGVGTILAGLLGTGSGTTSYSQNVGAIGVTKVGSRRVVQYSGMIMVICGIIGKVGALFITIPEPIIGGLFFVVFGMIAAVGLSSLQYVDLNSARNLFVLGFSIFFGIAVPAWMKRPENKYIIQTSIKELDQIFTVLLNTSMFVGGFLGLVLDNTVPGTKEERGLVKWEAMLKGKQVTEEDGPMIDDARCYDLPYIMEFMKKYKWMSKIPISPTYQPSIKSEKPNCFKRIKSGKENR